jgi:glycosyltransferase involved in cell wall biosynthesis
MLTPTVRNLTGTVIAGPERVVESPVITIAVPAFNRPSMLEETLASVARQTAVVPFEVVVCDDGRMPQTQRTVSRFPRQSFLYSPNPVTLGPVGNWNRCLSMARGEWVMVLHEDDALYPWFFECVLPHLRPESVAVCMRASQGLAQPDLPRPRTHPPLVSYPPRCFLKSSMTPFPGILVRRSVALRLGGFDEKWGPVADYEFWYRLSCAGRIDVLRAIGAFYRVAPGQWTEQIRGRMLGLAHLLRLRIAREQFSQCPRAGRWMARFFSYRNARFCADRVGQESTILRRCLELGRVPLSKLPSGWVWQMLRFASGVDHGHPRIANHAGRTAQI